LQDTRIKATYGLFHAGGASFLLFRLATLPPGGN